jgi:hypothetical protein
MQIFVLVIIATAAAQIQITNAVYDELSSAAQSLVFLSTGEELYAAPLSKPTQSSSGFNFRALCPPQPQCSPSLVKESRL